MKNTTIALLFALCLLAGCGKKKTPGTIPVLDIEAAIDNPQSFDLAEIADEINFISLDNSRPEAFIGEIQSITESKNRFYVADRSDNPVKVFDRDGQFIATRGRIGRGPDEFLGVEEVAADWENDNLYLMVHSGGISRPIRAYDAGGDIIARNDSITGGKIAYFDDKLLLFIDTNGTALELGDMYTFMETFSPELHRETALEASFKGISKMVHVTTDAGGQITSVSAFVVSPVIASDNGASLLVKEGRSDTVYHYIDGALEPRYHLDLGSYAISGEMFEPHFNKPLSFEHGFGVEYMYEGDRYILTIGEYPPLAAFLLFDRKEDYAGLSALGPEGDEGLFLDGIQFTPMYIRDNQLVGYMQAFDIVDNAEHITDPDLKALAATLTEDDNPVIVVMKLKK